MSAGRSLTHIFFAFLKREKNEELFFFSTSNNKGGSKRRTIFFAVEKQPKVAMRPSRGYPRRKLR
jgi:hypothetical protein